MSADLISNLHEVARSGSPSEKSIAIFLLNAVEDIPFETAASLAKRVGVSEASVSRFCRAVGCESFRDVKRQLRNDVGDAPWTFKDRLNALQQAGQDSSQSSRGMEMELSGLIGIYEMAQSAEWTRTAERLATSDRVFVVGFQTERGMAQYFAHQLQYLRPGVQLLSAEAGNYMEMLGEGTPACLVIFEARRYSRMAKILARKAQEQGLAVTLVTDRFCNWAHDHSDDVYALPTQFNLFWDSTALMANWSSLMVSSVFSQLGPEATHRMEQTALHFGQFTGHVDDPVTPIES